MTTNFDFRNGETVYYRHPIKGYRICTYTETKDIFSSDTAKYLRDNNSGDAYFIKNVCDYDIRTKRDYMIDYIAPLMGIDKDHMEAMCDAEGIL